MSTTGGLAVRCPCGLELAATGPDGLVQAVNSHLAGHHPDVARTYDVDDVLALAYRRPAAHQGGRP